MREQAIAAALPHRSNRRRKQEARWQVPIVDENRRIVGWTSEGPEAGASGTRHAAAEKLIGGPVTCAYVQISDRRAAACAGAPADWNEPWRCLAIVALRGAEQLRIDGMTLVDVD